MAASSEILSLSMELDLGDLFFTELLIVHVFTEEGMPTLGWPDTRTSHD